MSPSQVLDAQVDLTDRLGDPVFRHGLPILPITEQAADLFYEDSSTFTDPARNWMDGASDKFSLALRRVVQGSYCYRVTEDMCDLLQHAAESLEDEDAYDPSQAPTGAGFVRFDKPITLGVYSTGKPLKAHWLVWGPSALYWFLDLRENDEDELMKWLTKGDDGTHDPRPKLGRWFLIAWSSFEPGTGLGSLRRNRREVLRSGERGSSTALFLMQDMKLRAEGVDPETIEASITNDVEYENDGRISQALWMLLNQTIVETREEIPERPSRRRAARMSLPGRVTTIALRRSEVKPREDGESLVEWQHRWIVRGHWRWQACGAGRKDRKRIWVSPFVKGPEGMPLKHAEKIYDLRR